jgi:hypothetical protein
VSAEPLELPERIKLQNWDQGSIFEPRFDLWLADLSRPLAAASQIEAERLASAEEGLRMAPVYSNYADQRMIIVSQRCDLVASPEVEPFCEAIPLKVLPAENLPQANSARLFVVDRANRLVADQTHRLIFEKSLLPNRRAEQLILQDSPQWESFRAWCARRYSRYPFPDDFALVVGGALQFAIEKVNRGANKAAIQAIHSWRAISAEDPAGQVKVGFLVVYEAELLSEQRAAEVIAEIIDRARKRIPVLLEKAREKHPNETFREHEIQSYEVRSDDNVTLRDLRMFPPFNLEHYTYYGDEVHGAEPHDELNS